MLQFQNVTNRVQSINLFLEVTCERSLLMGDGREGVGGGAKSYDSEKAWPSVNHSKLSGWDVGGGRETAYM
jgi:hypothetical protein